MLEATKARKAVWEACKAQETDDCHGCPYRHTCEEQFPYIGRDERINDLLPCDYELTENGFMPKEENICIL